jgi:hypothetical protein
MYHLVESLKASFHLGLLLDEPGFEL